jgi:sulfatase modifying factor 1
MRRRGELHILLLALALGCSRSALDVPGAARLASGDDATADASPLATGSSSGGLTSSGSASSSGGPSSGGPSSGGSSSDGGSASGAGSGSSSGSGSGPDAGVDSGSQPPSCAPGGAGMTDCGPGGSGVESCCTSPELPAATFFRVYGGSSPMLQGAPATVSPFRLDRYLVTVGRFRQFQRAWAGGYAPAAGSGKHTHLNGGRGLIVSGGGYEPGWVASDNGNLAPTSANLDCSRGFSTWTAAPGSQESLPINCVNWFESYAFCIWDGGFLPSEAEWHDAAVGGSQQRPYPWGSTEPGTASEYAIYGCYYPDGTGGCTGVASLGRVGTAPRGAGLWGQLDLAGDVYEWTLDRVNNLSSFYNPCGDCVDLPPASSRMILGGAFVTGTAALLSVQISGPAGDAEVSRDNQTGLRCARMP